MADLICWPSPERLVMGIQIKTFDGKVHPAGEELVQIDTGYSGEILLPYDLYAQLGLRRWQYPQELWSVGTTASGQKLELILSRGYVVVPRLDQQFEVLIDTFVENVHFLIGRAFLRRFRVLFDGPREQVCLVLSENEHR